MVALPTIYTAFSRASVRIPAVTLLVDGKLAVDPAVQGRGYFTVLFRGTDLELVAGRFCGFVPINENCAVDIRPKMPVESLNRIFDVASLSFQRIADQPRPYDFSSEGSAPVVEFLASEFAATLREVMAVGLYKRYEQRSRSDDKPRGKINFIGTVRNNIARGKGHLVYTSSFEHEIDIWENRVIRAAGDLIIQKLLVQRIVTRGLIADIRKLLSYFAGVSPVSAIDFRMLFAGDAIRQETTQVRSYGRYDLALNIAALILKDRSAMVEKVGDEINLTAVVIDFEKLFEQYLRNILRLRRPQPSLPPFILDGNREGKKALFDGKSTPTAEPDIVIRQADGRTCLIVEVKYKSSPDRSDINQAVTYAISYRVHRVVLAYQATRAADAHLREIGRIGTVQVFGYGILLDAPDLDSQEADFAEAIFSLASSGSVEEPATT